MNLWPFGKKRDPQISPGLLSFPLFEGEAMPDPAAVLRFANELDPERPIRLVEDGEPGPVLQFQIEGLQFFAAHMPAPVPGNEVQENLLGSPFWNEEDSAEHRSHAVLICPIADSSGDAVAAASRIAASLLKVDGGPGWYVGSAGMVHSSAAVWDWVKAAEGDWVPMLPFWIHTLVTQDQEGTYSASTIGMEMFGHRDFEIVWSSMPPVSLREWLFDLCAYVLERGPVLLHGQTFGRSAEEKWKIEVGTSRLGKEGTVIRLVLG